MKDELTDNAFDFLCEELLDGVGDAYFSAFTAAIKDLPFETRDAATTPAIAYAVSLAEAAFIAGLRCGRDPLLLVLQPAAKRRQPGGREKRASGASVAQ
jgi:hypothetical protein